jgi:hypothetical protein
MEHGDMSVLDYRHFEKYGRGSLEAFYGLPDINHILGADVYSQWPWLPRIRDFRHNKVTSAEADECIEDEDACADVSAEKLTDRTDMRWSLLRADEIALAHRQWAELFSSLKHEEMWELGVLLLQLVLNGVKMVGPRPHDGKKKMVEFSLLPKIIAHKPAIHNVVYNSWVRRSVELLWTMHSMPLDMFLFRHIFKDSLGDIRSMEAFRSEVLQAPITEELFGVIQVCLRVPATKRWTAAAVCNTTVFMRLYHEPRDQEDLPEIAEDEEHDDEVVFVKLSEFSHREDFRDRQLVNDAPRATDQAPVAYGGGHAAGTRGIRAMPPAPAQEDDSRDLGVDSLEEDRLMDDGFVCDASTFSMYSSGGSSSG